MSTVRRFTGVLLTMLVAVPGWLAMGAAGMPAAYASSAGTVFVTTVPALGGVELDVRGTVVTTAPDGTASVALGDINGIAHDVTLARRGIGGGASVAINRIVPAAHVPHQSHLSVGLDVTSPATIVLLQGDSHIPPSHVTRLALHSILGGHLTVDPRRPVQLHLLSRKIHYVHGTLQAQPVTWAVEGVQADPGISVTTAQPRFDPFRHPRWKVRLAPVAGTVRVATVPSTPGVEFDLNGTALTTGPDGVATAALANLNDVRAGLRLASTTAGDREVSALRVSRVPGKVDRERRLIAALDVRRPVQLRFVDSHGLRVSPASIGTVQLQTGAGTLTELIGSEISAPALLLERVADRVGSAWGTREVTYSLSDVKINGEHAVFAGRQRFTPMDESVWTIKLSVFRMALTVRDALFGSRIESRAVITSRDGTHSTVTVGSSKPQIVTGIVRGLYTLTIDAAVVGGTTSVLVSRDGPVELRVITLLDTVLIGLAGALVLPAGVGIGIALNRRRRRIHASAT